MKKYNTILFFFYCLISFSQEVYNFDYYTEYEFKASMSDSLNTIREITYSNSNNNNYLLKLILKKDTVFSANLIDYSKQKMITYKDAFFINNINDVNLFKKSILSDYSLEECKNSKKNYYEINYYIQNGKNWFHIIRFKNNKKKKIINESFYETTPSEITKNQQYNFGILATPLWCEKFTLKNNQIITNSYFIEKGEKMYFRNLIKIKKTDFTINISTNNTKN
jgi:hypothetical protein